jgi:hypothetical protein
MQVLPVTQLAVADARGMHPGRKAAHAAPEQLVSLAAPLISEHEHARPPRFPCSTTVRCMRRRISSFTAFSLARTRLTLVSRRTMNFSSQVVPQQCVNLRNSKVLCACAGSVSAQVPRAALPMRRRGVAFGMSPHRWHELATALSDVRAAEELNEARGAVPARARSRV